MKVNKTYEEMIEYLFNKYEDVSEIVAHIAKGRLLDNPCRYNKRIVKKLYKARVLYDAGFDIKCKTYHIK